MEAVALEGGFAAPPTDAARAFRAAMDAMARPGTLHEIAGATPPAPVSQAAGALLLTLVDAGTGVFLAPSHDHAAVRDWITFHTSAPLVGQEAAHFALGTWAALCPLTPYPLGRADYPDRSATLIVEMADFAPRGATLSGPGIAETAQLNLPETEAFQANAALFPLGLDFFFTSGSRVAALPRTTRVR